MERDRKCFTIIWRIENYNFCYEHGYYFYSPSFVIHSLEETSWNFGICPNSSVRKKHIRFNVNVVNGPKSHFKLDFEISFLGDDTSRIYEGLSQIFADMDYSETCYVPQHRVHTQRRGMFLPPKTLTIHCRTYISSESFSDVGRCSIRTRFRKEKTAFIGLAEKFSKLVPDEKKILTIKSSSPETQLLILKLSLAGGLCCKERVWIEIIPIKKGYIKFCKCKLFLFDSEGTKTECGASEIIFNGPDSQEWKFPLGFTKGFLMKRNMQFLTNDTLSLRCEFAFSTGIEFEGVEDSEFGNLTIADKNHPRKFPSALEDMTCLWKEGVLCDMKLRTETETFNVHKNILSARSSVFKTMFTIEMKEKASDCLHIDDLEADTVRRMLTFIYSDDLEDLDWNSAKSLYFAADKYNIEALKYQCSDFLINNLQPSESCDLLLLSDRHHDEELKKSVQKFIAKHHEEILQSHQWINLGTNNPTLTTETFQSLYMGKWKNNLMFDI